MIPGRGALDDGAVVLVDAEREGGEQSGQDYDPRSRTWSELTGDPLGATFDRAATAIPGGLVLTATTLSGAEDVRPTLRAAVLDLAARTWTVLDVDRRTGGGRWSWTGERIIDVSLDVRNGNGGRFPQGGAVDPRTGAGGETDQASSEAS